MTKAEKEALKNGFISQWYHAAMASQKIKCCLCKREIVGLYVHVYKDGKYLPAHRDCRPGTTAKGRAKRKPKKPRCHETKALKKYRADHEGADER